MTCCIAHTGEITMFGPVALDTHKRAASLHEISNFVQQTTVKKIRTSVLSPDQIKHSRLHSNAVHSEFTWFNRQGSGSTQDAVTQAFSLLSEYDQEYLHEQLKQESKGQADHRYLQAMQLEIDPQKRLVLVDWLSEVVDEFELRQATLYLAVSVLDRYLSLQPVPRAQLQLLGVTCLWIASKFEDTNPPSLQEVIEITDHSYAADDVLRMEALVLAQLEYQLAVPTSLTFLHQLVSHVQEDLSRSSPFYQDPAEAESEVRLMHTAEYLLELALLTPDTLRYKPSVIAASALQLSLELVTCDVVVRQACSKLCSALSSAAAQGLDGCVAELKCMQYWAATAAQPPSMKAKYSSHQYSYAGVAPACDISKTEPAYSAC